jgi:hypothetical protein
MLLLCSQIIPNQHACYPLLVRFAKVAICMAGLCSLALPIRRLLFADCLFSDPFIMGFAKVSVSVTGIRGLLLLRGGCSIPHIFTGYPLTMSPAKIGILTSASIIFPCFILYLPLSPVLFVRGLGLMSWFRWGEGFGPRGRIWYHNSFPAGPLALLKYC